MRKVSNDCQCDLKCGGDCNLATKTSTRSVLSISEIKRGVRTVATARTKTLLEALSAHVAHHPLRRVRMNY